MNSADIQQQILDWANSRNFTAPYGVLSSSESDKSGRKYLTVVFGYARTRDVEVRIYNRSFMLVRDSYNGNTVFKDVSSLMTALEYI